MLKGNVVMEEISTTDAVFSRYWPWMSYC